MQMTDIFQHAAEVVIFGSAFGDHGMFPVVYHVRAALSGSVLRIIYAHASTFCVADAVDIDSESAKLDGKRIADRILRKSGEIAGFCSEDCERGADVCLSASVSRLQCSRQGLCEPCFSRGCEAQHDFSESGNE